MIKNLFLVIVTIMLITTLFSGCISLSNDDDEDGKDDADEYYPLGITITSPKNNKQVSGTIDITVSIYPERPVVEIAYYLDEIQLESSFDSTYSWDTTSVDNGQHLIEVSAMEIGSHVPIGTQPAKASIRVKVYNAPYIPPEENNPPGINLNKPKGDVDGVYRGSITINGEVEDLETDIDSIEMRIDDEEWFDVSVSHDKWHFTLEPESFTGEVEVSVRAFDGEEYSEVKSLVLDCDNTPPGIEILTPSESETISGTVNLRVNVEDEHEIDHITFTIADIDLQTSKFETCKLDTTGYENGDYELTVGSADLVGNEDTKTVAFTIHNNHPPRADIKYPLEGSEYQEEETISFDASYSSDPDSDELSYQWESGIDGFLSHEEVFEAILTTGDHTITLTVEDSYGEQSSISVHITVIEKENEIPEISISSHENGAALKDIVTIQGTAADNDGEIEAIDYRVDEGDWNVIDIAEDWSFDLNTSELEDGDHTLDIRITDDEEAESIQTLEFSTDNTAPGVNITSPTDEYLRGTITVECEITEEGSGLRSIEFRIKNESVQKGMETTYEWDTTREEDGPEYNIEIVAVDNLGNEGSSIIIVLVDNTPPEITSISPEEGSYVSGNISIEPMIYEIGSGLDTVIFELDGEEVKNSSSQVYLWFTSDSGDGEHTFDITGIDRAGNRVRESFSFLVDNTPPTIRITAPGEGTRIQGPGKIETESSDNAGGSGIRDVRFFFNGLPQFTDSVFPYEFDFDSDDYTDGDYRVTVIIVDNAGNTAQDGLDIKLGEGSDPIISNPHTNFLTPYDVNGKERLIFDDHRAVPIVSSRVKNGGVMPSVNWDGLENPKSFLNISMPAGTGYAGFSGNIAISYWTVSNSAEKAIVVDSYQHAVMMTAYASIMDYPIIVYDSANKKISDEALWKLGTIYPNQIITLGNTPYNNQGVTVFSETEIVDWTIGAAQYKGITIDYITMVNPNDSSGNSNTAYLSAFAGVFASHHDGLILPCPASSSEMNTRVHDAMDSLNEAGMSTKHICIVGDHISLPMGKVGSTPGDNLYADLDNNVYTIEVSIGRVLAKELKDISYYADRVVNYEDYLAIETETVPLRILNPLHWNNNAMIYMGWAAEFAEDSENHCREHMWAMGRFNTQDDSDKAHAGLGTTVMMVDLSMSNFFIINADHGMPTGTVTWGSEHLPDMHPGITFGVSCSLGRIDGVNKQASVTYTMMEKGMNVYLAPTRTAYGSFVQTYPYQPIAAPGLCYLYLTLMIDNDYDSGVAYMHAKNELINNGYGGNVDRTTTWQYLHFGDPGFNPYEPCNEGSLF